MSDLGGHVRDAQLFAGLTPEQCERFAPLARVHVAPRGERLFSIGDPAGVLYVVAAGVVELTMPLAVSGGEHEVVVGVARTGETVAWSALIAPHRYTMSAQAATDVELMAFARGELQSALRADAQAGLTVLENLATVVGRRLQVMQALFTRALQRSVNETVA